jgi:glycosyltransferase involved in cell wall biosynthesis
MKNKSILMIGTSLETKGGISAVVDSYKNAGLFDDFGVIYIVTHSDGSIIKKLYLGLKSYAAYFYYLWRQKIQIVHIHVSFRMSFWRKLPFILLSKLLGKKIIFHLHSSGFREFYEEELTSWQQKIALKAISMSNKILVLNQESQNWLLKIIPDADVLILNNGITPKNYDFANRNSLQMLFLGQINREKGFWDLLNALGELKKNGFEFQLIAGGDGDLDTAKELTHKYGLDQNVTFVGWIRGKAKQRVLETSSILVLPSYYEAMPMSILEGMSASMPIVASNVGGIPRQVENGVEGFLIEPGNIEELKDKFELLLTSNSLRLKMSQAAKSKFDKEFSTSVILPKLKNIYEETLIK